MFELELWVRKNKKGLTFSSSTGFLLPNGAMRSPDACWISDERWGQVAEDQKKKFLPVSRCSMQGPHNPLPIGPRRHFFNILSRCCQEI